MDLSLQFQKPFQPIQILSALDQILYKQKIQENYNIKQNQIKHIEKYNKQLICKQVLSYIIKHLRLFQNFFEINKEQKEIQHLFIIFKIISIGINTNRNQLQLLLSQERSILHKHALFVRKEDQYKNKYYKTKNNIQNKTQLEYKAIGLLQKLDQLKKLLKSNIHEINQLDAIFTKIYTELDTNYQSTKITVCLIHYLINFSNKSLYHLSKLFGDDQKIDAITYLKMINYNRQEKRGLLEIALLYKSEKAFNQTEYYLMEIISYNQKDIFYKKALFELGKLKIQHGQFYHGKRILQNNLKIINKYELNQQQLYYDNLLKLADIEFITQNYTEAISVIENELNSSNSDNITQIILLKCYYILGNCYYGQKQFQKALYYFKKFYEKNKDNTLLMRKIADIYLFAHNHQLSLFFYQEIDKIKPNNVSIIISIAYNYFLEGNHDACMEIIQKAKLLNLSQVESEIYYKQIMLKINGNDDASLLTINLHESARKIKAQKYQQIGKAYINSKRFNIAFTFFLQSYKFNKKNIVTLSELSSFYALDHNHQKSAKYLNQLWQIQTQSQYVLLKSGFILNLLKRFEQAEIYLQKLYNLYPQNLQGLIFYIINQIRLSKSDKALELILILFECKTIQTVDLMVYFIKFLHKKYLFKLSSSLLFKLIFIYKEKEEILNIILNSFSQSYSENAYEITKCLINLNPYKYNYYFKFYSLIMQKSYSQINLKDIKIIQNAINYIHEDCDIYFMIGNLYYKKKDYKKSLYNIKKSFLLGENQQAFNLLQILYKIAKYDEDIYLIKMIQLKPKNPWLYYRMSKICKQKNQTQNEIFHLQKIVEYDSNNDYSYVRLTQIYKMYRNQQKILYYLVQLIQIQQTNFKLYQQIIEIFIKINQKQKALFYVNKMLQNCTYNQKKYQVMTKLYKQKYHQNQNQIQMIQFMVNNYFNQKNKKNDLLLSYYYRYFQLYSKSFLHFMKYFKQLKISLFRQEFTAKIKTLISDMLLNIMKKDIDLYLKIIYLCYLMEDEKLLIQYNQKLMLKLNITNTLRSQKIYQKNLLRKSLQNFKYNEELLIKIQNLIQPYIEKIIEQFKNGQNGKTIEVRQIQKKVMNNDIIGQFSIIDM